MNLFSKYFDKILNEDIGMTSAGVFGGGGDQGGMFPGGSDFYAPGDMRIPDFLGSRKHKKRSNRKKSKRKKRKNKIKKEQIKLQRRKLSGM